MQPVINPNYPGLSVRVADEGFAAYIWGSDFSFEVAAYGAAQIGAPVAQWPVTPITPYRKCYGIDPNTAEVALFWYRLFENPLENPFSSSASPWLVP